MQTIDLDCPPGATRPGDLIRGIIQDLDIQPVTYDVTPLFGWAQYEFDVPRERWVADIQPTIKARITECYNLGFIRYGSW